MESTNVIIDDSFDFSKFSKEDFISSLIEEIGNEAATNQPVVTPSNTGSSPREYFAIADKSEIGIVKLVATEIDQEIQRCFYKCFD